MRNKILITGLLCLGLLSCNLFVLDKAQATVSTTTNKVLYSGDGFSTSFAFSFNIFAKTDLVVQVNDTLGVVHTLTLNTDYTISTTTFPNSGNVILSAGGGWPVIPIGDTLLILRQLPFKQLINITDYSATPAATWNQAFDRACMLEQQLQEQINRTIIASPFSSSITFPAPVANDLIGWDSTGSILINYIPNTSAYITFPLPVVEGGTGASTASGARTNLGSAASGANSDITSLSGITTPLSTAQGGTGVTTGIPAQVGFGSWVDKSSSYAAQQAATDGFVVAISSSGQDIALYTDANANPTTIRSKFAGNGTVVTGISVFSPIKKNDYWKIVVSAGTPTVYWIPLGS
jgi:hypothetical protein